ncbi:outer membrane lipoprotein carrier protein LolA [Stenotrophomonas sp. HITSZ_GD]|uniref:outer membrane lipoprotein carrier protein LolA n=1 Tax=Stenotrophomonas sp. HITSZ_GD TaxID=3037248 RepID=UPI00240DF29D|nr:outer membrane lipoprotein carrier protein LolA [Stenotrophomonas sp. HITSZ_GD]MDG2525339.1 outer membrane lipoprotein carrier protein LolA [Stenotrophomonas sp. HITSZ_GD]
MKSVFLAFALALVPAWPALAAPAVPPELAQVQQRVARPALLRADFVQEKQVAGFRNPLRSQGQFVLAQDRGVIWRTLKPFPSDVVLTRDRILSRQADGSVQVEVDGRQQPALRAINAMMFALMSGDVQAMSSSFEVRAELLPGNGWRLHLTPRSAMLAKAFASLQLEGDQYVRKVEIEEANHDRTRLSFDNFRQAPPLAADEARSLE